MKIVLIWASNDPEKYWNKILKDLISNGKSIIAPKLGMAGGQPKCNFELKDSAKRYMVPILQDRLKNIWDIDKATNCYLIDLNKIDNEKENIFDNESYAENKNPYGWLISD